MKIWVSSLAQVHGTAAQASPAKVISLLSPGDIFPVIEGIDGPHHHKMHLHDIREERDGLVAPQQLHVETLVNFLDTEWSADAPLLVHCWAGISRSTATALIAACLKNPDTDEKEIAGALAQASPTAFPNTRIAAFADEIMGRGGRLAQAAQEICSDTERLAVVTTINEAKPFSMEAQFGS
ncbi:MAG: protein tyrosine phosphatase [Pseudomonadota bacterium]